MESDLHGDLAISSNIDTYQNLTLKTLSAFRWMQTFCSSADFILKIDDDMFIQTQRLRQLVIDDFLVKSDTSPIVPISLDIQAFELPWE